MRGDDTSPAGLPIAEVVAGVRAVLAAIDAGQITASDVQRAYLVGAADMLDALSDGDT